MIKMLKVLSSKALAGAVGAAVMFSCYGPTLAHAAEDKQYISEVYISYGADDAAAKKWLTDNGYTVLDQNLNEGAESAQWLSWAGLASEKRSVYLGYKTTTDPDEAITDMRVMHMNGEFSYEDYEKLLETRKSEIKAFLNSLKPALAEYRENYKKKKTKAVLAHDNLNLYTDDDSADAPLGDLLLAPIKEEMSEEDYNKEPEKHADMTTIMLQGNLDSVKAVMETLACACDTSDTTWLQRLKELEGSDSLYEKYEAENPGLSASQLDKLLRADNDEAAKSLANSFDDIRGAIKLFDEVGLSADASESEVEDYFKAHTDKSDISWASAAMVSQPLSDTEYEGETLAEFINDTAYDFSEAEDREYLYPIVYSLSDGQRALLDYASLDKLVMSAALDEEGWKKAAEKAKELNKDSSAQSVYAGIDRSAFTPGGVALTNEARNLNSTTGLSFEDGIFGVGLDWKPLAVGGAAALTLAVGAGFYALGAGVFKTSQRAGDLLAQYKYNAEECTEEMFKYVKKLINERVVDLPVFSEEQRLSFQNIEYWYDLDPKTQDVLVEKLSKSDEGFKKVYDNYQNFNEKIDEIEQKIGTVYYTDGRGNVTRGFKQYKGDEDMMISSHFKYSGARYLGKCICVAGLLLAVGTAALSAYQIYSYYHQDLVPIPRKMVNESADKAGRAKYTYYDAALCNRSEQGFANDKLAVYGDLNGDVGKQWLALYTTKDKAAGDPVLADIIAQKNDDTLPLDKTGLKLFGKTDAVNLVDEAFGYNDTIGGLRIFYATDEKTADSADTESSAADTAASSADTKAANANEAEPAVANAAGSAFSGGVYMIVGVLSAAAGAGVCFLFTMKRKKKES